MHSVMEVFVFLHYIARLTLDHFNKALTDSPKAMVGYRKRSKTECISANVRKCCSSLQGERYRSRPLKGETKNSTLKGLQKKLRWLLEWQASRQVRRSTGDWQSTGQPKMKSGSPFESVRRTLITEEQAKLERQREEFEWAMNRPEPQTHSDITKDTGTCLTLQAEEDVDINTGTFTVHESKMSSTNWRMAWLQERTATYAEMLKAGESWTQRVSPKTSVTKKRTGWLARRQHQLCSYRTAVNHQSHWLSLPYFSKNRPASEKDDNALTAHLSMGMSSDSQICGTAH